MKRPLARISALITLIALSACSGRPVVGGLADGSPDDAADVTDVQVAEITVATAE